MIVEVKEMIFRKCPSCGALVTVLKECNCPCGIECCDEKMEELVANSVDAAAEKHVPTYQKEGDSIVVTVNHVMEEEHYIKYLIAEYKDSHIMNEFKPHDKLELKVPYESGMMLYSYCNKHDLWSKKVD